MQIIRSFTVTKKKEKNVERIPKKKLSTTNLQDEEMPIGQGIR